MNAITSGVANSGRRTKTTLAAFLVGLPMAAGVLAMACPPCRMRMPAIQEREHYITQPRRVRQRLRCSAAPSSALGAKVLRSRIERALPAA